MTLPPTPRSPNHGPRPDGVPVDILLVHYTGMPTGALALERLCDPAAQVSAHYLVDEDGTVFSLVPEDRRAWHAGVGFWRGERDINSRSVGVELVNPGHEWGYRPFPATQMDAFADLARGILDRHGISPHRVLAHSDIAPSRKEDPGELFDWRGLAARGIGFWPEPDARDEGPGYAFAEAQTLLARFGYEVPATGVPDAPTRVAATAFQRRFLPDRLGFGLDGAFMRMLRAAVRQTDALDRR
ncbi:N-acetylmuramoyl-L-alanine amidase [Skermanella stibiiresistens SB22]|uniref:N-acetylmuramoyl-L-alanine amidase n=1 Tax=Skermanella stibiiresistens SB22 TaxID=1385369 RepID=W9GY18_9PROT|nr:N-acetylmuramoyl-L-alanine amidase [Skermanella stibiiresistens]EWY37516.1 N-acetylmuramoyl-L-alanine amidase [Skermanella stibiiresistens SB22]